MEYNVSAVKQFDRHFSVANRLYVTCKRSEYTNHTFRVVYECVARRRVPL